MTDGGKFRLGAWAAVFLLGAAVLYNGFGEEFIRRIAVQAKRRNYYETVIRPKGLSLHRAEYWEPVER